MFFQMSTQKNVISKESLAGVNSYVIISPYVFGINKNVENVFARKLTNETRRILKMRINVKYEILEMTRIETSAFP